MLWPWRGSRDPGISGADFWTLELDKVQLELEMNLGIYRFIFSYVDVDSHSAFQPYVEPDCQGLGYILYEQWVEWSSTLGGGGLNFHNKFVVHFHL